MPSKHIVLASASPRRKELLEGLGITFDVMSADIDETLPQHIEPAEAVQVIARRKAESVADHLLKEHLQEAHIEEFGTQATNHFVIGADTLVTLDGQVYGKPENAFDAVRTLTKLSRRTHQVITGVCVLKLKVNAAGTRVIGGKPTLAGSNVSERALFAQTTDVTFYALSTPQIEAYVATGEPMDKAGAYGIQERGALLVKKIDGDYFNVVGLPIARLMQEVPELLD